jgi:hypothetical protein
VAPACSPAQSVKILAFSNLTAWLQALLDIVGCKRFSFEFPSGLGVFLKIFNCIIVLHF